MGHRKVVPEAKVQHPRPTSWRQMDRF